MIQVNNWIATIPEEERRIAYVGENTSEHRLFRLHGSGYGGYAYFLDLAFDLSTVTTTAQRQRETTSQNVQETVGTNQSQSVSTKTTENAILSETTVDCDTKTDVVPLEMQSDDEGVTLTWTILAQHTRLPGTLQATLRAVAADGSVKKSAIMTFEVEPAVIAVAAIPPAVSEQEQLIQNIEGLYAKYVAKAEECEENVQYWTSYAEGQCRSNLSESNGYALTALSSAQEAAASAKAAAESAADAAKAQAAAEGAKAAANESAAKASADSAAAATHVTAAETAKTDAESAKAGAETAAASAAADAAAAADSKAAAEAAATVAAAKAAEAAAAGGKLQLIRQITTTEALGSMILSADMEDTGFSLDRFCLLIQFPEALELGQQTGKCVLSIYANGYTANYCLHYQAVVERARYVRLEGEIVGAAGDAPRCITSVAVGSENPFGNSLRTGWYGYGFTAIQKLIVNGTIAGNDSAGLPAGTVLTLYGRKA